MASDGQPIERLREYLRTLKPEARAMLIAELERGLLRGEDIAGNELILQELRKHDPRRGPAGAAHRRCGAAVLSRRSSRF